ncbi:hypothetical protein CBM2631_A250167 [Cupriavidus taiwanensis]|nr:hypothetical protein CBM2588_A180165 [Cupriavidus taiwanensis]SOZ57848.1 hypothetical protein CBM2617_A260017 [Cupriavidus taiwanensis]SOZ87837.1 hypothetical protein CBM2621_A210166 [Cupriavidus taiwanensis]SPA14934.1 hypothetical protein CBM2631_A250167 [Cupriavidus taiwanensis]
MAERPRRHVGKEMAAADQHVGADGQMVSRTALDQRAVIAHAERSLAHRPCEIAADQVEFGELDGLGVGHGSTTCRDGRWSDGGILRQISGFAENPAAARHQHGARRAFQQDTAAHHSHDRHALRRFAGSALRLLVLPGRMGHIVPNRKGAPSKTLIVK